jgi:ankyrin repeat protein
VRALQGKDVSTSIGQPESTSAAGSQIELTEINTAKVFALLRTGQQLYFELRDPGPGFVGRSSTAPAGQQITHSIFQTLRDLGLIEVYRIGSRSGDALTSWGLARSLRRFDFEATYGTHFMPCLLNPAAPIDETLTTAIPPEARRFASIALTVYAKEGDVAGIKRALALGADANAIVQADNEMGGDYTGASALMLACWNGPDCFEGIRALIEAEADPTFQSAKGATIMTTAALGCARYDHCAKNSEPLIDLLVASGASADHGFSNGQSPLFLTVNQYDGLICDSAIRALLKHGANPNAIADYGLYKRDILTHVAWTARTGKESGIAAVKALVHAGAEVNLWPNPVKNITSTPLGAVAETSPRLVEFLLEHGASADIVDETGKTLLQSLEETRENSRLGGDDEVALDQSINLIEEAVARSASGETLNG